MAEVADAVREIVARFVGPGTPPSDISADVGLGADGLGLDSVEIVEVVVECEDRFGIALDTLFERDRIFVQDLIDHVRQAWDARASSS